MMYNNSHSRSLFSNCLHNAYKWFEHRRRMVGGREKTHCHSGGFMFMCLTAIACLLMATSCEKAESEFSSHRVRFLYDNSILFDETLATALNSLSPGVFVRIWMSGNYYYFEDFRKQPTQQPVMERDRLSAFIIGLYNESGIIVGFGNLDNPPIFFAYDAQCPNCYSETSLPRYLLTMKSNGIAVCGRCHREYNLNNHGIVTKGDAGKKLERYHASTTGPNGVLTVSN